MTDQTKQLIEAYYAAFNRGDMQTFFNLMDEQVIHDINQGQRVIGKPAFQQFMDHMNHCYREKITDLIIFVNPEGTRAAAEFIVEGTYITTDKGFPAATGQTYRIAAGAFFSIQSSKITRVTNYYNVKEWVNLISHNQEKEPEHG